MSFESFKDHLIGAYAKSTKIATLRGRSFFTIKVGGTQTNLQVIINNYQPVNSALVEKVYQRFFELEDTSRLMTGNYTDPKWQECPNRIISPYIAQLVRQWWEMSRK